MFLIDAVDTNAIHASDFVYDIPDGIDCWLLILTQTPAVFLTPSGEKQYPSNCIALFPPHYPLYYRACADTYCDDWLRFIASDQDIEPTSFPLGQPIEITLPHECHDIFSILCLENWHVNEYKAFNIDYLIHILLNKLLQHYQLEKLPYQYNTLVELRKDIYRNPEKPWTITLLSELLHLSPSHTQLIYKKAFHISCMDDVIASRIKKAKEQLLYTNKTTSEIAINCGYNNIEHFFRQFRKSTGVTPNDFRKQKKEK